MKPHNPDNLTPEQVGAADGWRLLDEDEIQPQPVPETSYTNVSHLPIIYWSSIGTWTGTNNGPGTCVLRTKLTRAELRAARGLPEETQTKGGDESLPAIAHSGTAESTKKDAPCSQGRNAAPASNPPGAAILKAANEARTRVSGYTPAKRADLVYRGRLAAEAARKAASRWGLPASRAASDTPETDAQEWIETNRENALVLAKFARDLERRLAAVLRERDALATKFSDLEQNFIRNASMHNTTKNALIERAEKAERERDEAVAKVSELSTKIAMAAKLQRLTEDNQVKALQQADSLRAERDELRARLAVKDEALKEARDQLLKRNGLDRENDKQAAVKINCALAAQPKEDK